MWKESQAKRPLGSHRHRRPPPSLADSKQLNDLQRVDPLPVNGQPPVQMRTGNAPRCTDFAELLPCFYHLPRFHCERREVAIEGVDAKAVVNHNRVPRKE